MSTVQPSERARRKRFAAEDFTDLDEVADPHTTEDDTHEPLRKRAWEYRWFLLFGVPIGAIAIVILLGYTWHLVPELLTNRYVQAIVGLAALVGTTAFLADRRRMA